MNKGRLYLIPTPLSDTGPSHVMPEINIQIICGIKIFIVEEIRTARRFLKKCGYKGSFDDVTFIELNEHTATDDTSGFLEAASSGMDTGLMSEAGLPCIADPGYNIVRAAHSRGIRVIPLTGPSSLFLALMASGLNGQQFIFHGYLPVSPQERSAKIREIEGDAIRNKVTQIFIETPYRNIAMFESLLRTCHSQTLLCIAADITSEQEYIRTMTIESWKSQKPDIHKKPAVFLLGTTK